MHSWLDELSPVGRERAALEAEFAELVRLEAHVQERQLAFTAAIDGLDDGGVDGAGVNRSRGRRSARRAKRVAATASMLEGMPNTRAALAAGRITEEHVEAAAEAAQRTSAEEADQELAGDAERQPADLFGRQARRWADAKQRDDEHQDRHERQRCARELTVWERPDGMTRLNGALDPVAGASVRKALAATVDRLWRADGGREGDPDAVRTPAQRRADALVELLAGDAPSGDRGPAKRPHPRHTVVVAVDAGRLRVDDPHGVARIADGTPLPQSVLERICCDAELVGAVYDTDGAVLWQGRRTRLATDDQWAQLIARDGGCVTGCGSGPEHCEAHHLVPFTRGGTTDIDGLVLICTHEHHLVHDHGWMLRRGPDGTSRLVPPATGPARHRHGGPQQRRPAA